MMISPERFLDLYIDKTYSELLAVRDELLESIRAFENHTYDPKLDWIMPSPDTVYQCNLEYLGKICELISKKYNQEFICEDDDDNDTPFIEVIRDYLGERGLVYDTSLVMEINNRRNGKKYTIQDNVRGMIYSMLTSQTKWHRIEPHLKEIDKLFFGYDPGMILAHEPEYFYEGLFAIKCGNRSTKAQMESLAYNIRMLQHIEAEFGSVDTFITSEPAECIVQKLCKDSSPYKMKMLGQALAWEYLRNMGVDGAKPDTHLRRFFGEDRMGDGDSSPATASEVNQQVTRISEQTGMLKVEIDNLIWSFCADGYGEICTAVPHCQICPIRDYCKR